MATDTTTEYENMKAQKDKLLQQPDYTAEAYDKGFYDGLEAAAKLCDRLYEGERGVWIGVDEAAEKIRALKVTP